MGETETEEGTTITLHVGVAADDGGFLRQECPSCLLEFKVKADEASKRDVLEWWVAKAVAESEVGGGPVDDRALGTLTCPYCASPGRRQAFLHSTYRAYLLRIARREIVEPMLFEALDEMERTLSRESGGLLSIRVEGGRRIRTPRPISGPEPDDMVRVACLGCAQRFKMFPGWAGSITCPSCASPLRLA